MATKKLFVSYRRTSWSFTYWLVDELDQILDAEIFVDYTGIDEADFESALLRNLRESDAVILVVSEDTFNPSRIHYDKDWVRREIREALLLKKPIALACHEGKFPPTDLPEDIQAIRNAQGIEFYPRYFRAGVYELAKFLDRATPVKLQTPIPTIPDFQEPSHDDSKQAPSQKAVLSEAIGLHEAGHYDRAIQLYDRLIAENYRPRLISISELRTGAIAEQAAEQSRWEAGETYDEIAALFRIDPARASDEYARFIERYPDYIEDPAGLVNRIETFQKQVVVTPKPRTKLVAPLQDSLKAATEKPANAPRPKAELPTKLVAQLKGHTKQVNSVAFSPDGATLASGSGGDFFGEDTNIRLWDVAQKQQIATLAGHTDTVRTIDFSPDGALLASASDDKTVRIWNVANQQQIGLLSTHTDFVRGIAFSPDGALLASASDDKTIRLWNVASRQPIGLLMGHAYWVFSVAFSPDGTLLASASGDKTVRLWNVASQQQIGLLMGHTYWVYRVAFSPDGTLLASASGDKTVRLWNVASQQPIGLLSSHTDFVRGITFSPDGTLLASSSDDKTIRLWNVTSQQLTGMLTGHTGWIRSIAFSPDGTLLASGSDDQTIILWA